MYCSNCGAEIQREDVKFCGACGFELVAPEVAVAPTTSRQPATRRAFFVVGLVLLLGFAAVAVLPLLREHDSGASSSPAPLSQQEAADMADALESGSSEALDQVMEPGVRAELGADAALPAGSSISIEASTFRSNGDELATVEARMEGAAAGRYLLYLIWERGRWVIYAAEEIP